MSGWIGDGLDYWALATYLHFIVKVVALGVCEGRVLRTGGDIEGCNWFVWSRSLCVRITW